MEKLDDPKLCAEDEAFALSPLHFFVTCSMRYILCSFIIAFIHKVSVAQIINTESQRIQSDTTGWFGSVGTSFLFQKNAVQVTNINATAHVEYKTNKDLYLLLVNFALLKGSGQTFSNNLFNHLRYNYKINKWLRWELFTQLQQNSVTGIQLRMLAGTGPRFKLTDTKHISLYTATAVMYEHEKEKTTPPVIHRDIRSSDYVSLTYRPSKNSEIITTLFYQPLFSNFSDYRILNEINITFKLVTHLSFTTAWYYLYDSKPAASTPKLNYSMSNGIQYDF